jgi:ribosome-binding factor A
MECFRKSGKLHPVLFDSPLSLTKVNISPDLKVVNAFFLPFNTSLSIERILEALEGSKGAIREYVSREVKLKYSPEIRFYHDHDFDKWQFIEVYQDQAEEQ